MYSSDAYKIPNPKKNSPHIPLYYANYFFMQKKLTIKAALAIVVIAVGCAKAPLTTTTTTPTKPTARKASVAVCDYDLSESNLTAIGYSKVFDESFNSNLNNWTTWVGGAYNGELQLYQANNLSVANGILQIAAKKETATGPVLPGSTQQSTYAFTSGRIEGKQNFSASTRTPKVRISARLKLPKGYGMWPAFWSYGAPWPTQGEIDIMEARGNDPMQYSTAYWWGRRAGVNTVVGSDLMIVTNADLTACFHVYEVVWEKNALTYLLDGVVVTVKTGNSISGMFGKLQRVTLNVAVGGSFFSNLDVNAIAPGTMDVDWVKVFTSK